MNLQTNSKSKGFTIIEVVLVLAIAGLIFLMVFIALPALQRNQRDTQRRNSLSEFAAQITQYQTNNKGAVPLTEAAGTTCTTNTTGITCFVSRYMTGNIWKDPSTGAAYSFKGNDTAALASQGQWVYKTSAKCNGEGFTGGTSRQFAVAMKLEGSGIACQDNASS